MTAAGLSVGAPTSGMPAKLAIGGVTFLVFAVGLSLAALTLKPAGPGPATLNICGALPVGSPLPNGSALSPTQSANAAIITAVARQVGAGQVGAIDAVDASFTETRLYNDHFGTGGAFGLFQETPGQGWGSVTQVENPLYAAQAFFTRLMALPGWQSVPTATAAQAVERSAYPGRYQRWVAPAGQLVAGLSGTGACTNGTPALAGAVTALPAGFSLPAGTPVPVAGAVAYALAQLGKPYLWGGTGPGGYDCSGLVMMAYRSVGISLPRSTYAQVYAGQPVYSPAQLAPGDLIFTEGSDPGPGGAPGHVGMYLGHGLVIDAPYTGHPIEITPLSSWLPQIVAMRQIV